MLTLDNFVAGNSRIRRFRHSLSPWHQVRATFFLCSDSALFMLESTAEVTWDWHEAVYHKQNKGEKAKIAELAQICPQILVSCQSVAGKDLDNDHELKE